MYTQNTFELSYKENQNDLRNSEKEEQKAVEILAQNWNSLVEESKSVSEWNVQFDHHEERPRQSSIKIEDDLFFQKLKSELNKRKKYKANWLHKILTIIPSCMWKKYKVLMRK